MSFRGNKTFSRNFDNDKGCGQKKLLHIILYVPTFVIDGHIQIVSVSKAAAFSIVKHCTMAFMSTRHKIYCCDNFRTVTSHLLFLWQMISIC